jgi:aerobic carbon-monoxide dehydrogenase medium subunit
MTPFELAEPRSLREAIALLDPDDASIRPIAGGTALMLMMKTGVYHPQRLVSLRAIKELRAIEAAGGALTIGAMTPLSVVERSETVHAHAPVITRTMRTLSNRRVRNVATIGGNLAHADPHMDLPPVLIALGAHVVVAGPSRERTLPVEDLFAGYFETSLARDELIKELHVPAQGSRRACYLKCTTRAVHDWPALGVAVSLDAEDGAIRDVRIVLSAATDRPIRSSAAEERLRRASISDAALAEASDAAAEGADVIEDGQGSAAYKRELLRVYVGRALRTALNGAPARANGRH